MICYNSGSAQGRRSARSASRQRPRLDVPGRPGPRRQCVPVRMAVEPAPDLAHPFRHRPYQRLRPRTGVLVGVEAYRDIPVGSAARGPAAQAVPNGQIIDAVTGGHLLGEESEDERAGEVAALLEAGVTVRAARSAKAAGVRVRYAPQLCRGPPPHM